MSDEATSLADRVSATASRLTVRRAGQITSYVLGTGIVWLILHLVLPRGLPLGIVLRGAVFGVLYGLLAAGIVLIYRANRVVNFAQAELGAVAAVLAIQLVLILKVNYFLAIACGLIGAALTGIIIEVGIIRRFRSAPRLILAVATIGIAQILNALAIQIPLWFQPPSEGLQATPFKTPFSINFTIRPAVFTGDYVVAVVVVVIVLAALTWFLRFTDYGVAIRAAAENGDRAHLLGIPVPRLSTMVWAIAAFLSAVAVILRIPLVGFSSFTSVSAGGPSLLLRTFAAAVIARMESLPLAVAAGIGLGIFESGSLWALSNGTYSDAMLVGVILIALLVQRGHFSRAAETGISTWKALQEVREIPHELRPIPEVKWGFRGLWVALGAFVITYPIYATPDREQLAALIFITAIVAVSLVVLTGWVGQISLGQWALVGFGGAATSVLVGRHMLDLFLALPVSMAVSALVALVIGIPALRIRGPFLAVTTLAFAVTSFTFFLEDRYLPWFIEQRIGRPALWGRLPIEADWQFYYFSLAFLAVAFIAAYNIRRSRTGRAMLAVRDNEPASQSVSLNVPRLKLLAFVLSGAIAGMAGWLFILHQRGLNTDSFGPEVSIRLFTMVVIGGLASLPGAIFGAVYVRGAEFFLSPGWSQLLTGVGLIVILWFLPGGLGQGLYRIRDEYLRWVAKRRGIVVPSLLADVRQELEEPEDVDIAGVLGAAPNGQRRAKREPETVG